MADAVARARSRRTPVRRRIGTALAAGVAVVLAGCAGVPAGGASHAIEGHAGSPQADLDRPYVRLLPPSPQSDDDPTAIMDGFQVAMGDFTADHAAARRYLTPEEARTWDADARTVVYASLQQTNSGGDETTFDFAVTPVAVVARDHGFALDEVQETYSATATRQRNGAWRLSDVRPGTLLSVAEFERAFRGVDVYFPAAGGDVLVPDHVFLPVPPSDLPTAMVTQLVHGPTSWLAPAVRHVAPAGTSVRSVVVGPDGTAMVRLGGSASMMTGSARRLLLAAMTWTLVGQLPDVKAVQLAIGRATPTAPTTTQDFQSFDPAAFPSGSRATYVDGGHVVQLEPPQQGGQPHPDVQPALDGAVDPVAPVGARGLAAVRRGKSGDALQVYVGDRWQVVYRARGLSAPTWMPDGSAVWAIATDASGRQRVVAVGLSSTNGRLAWRARTVPVSLIGSGLRVVGRLTEPRMSRDGTRLAVIRTVAGPGGAPDARPFVARIDATGGRPALAGLRPLAPPCPALGNQRCLTSTTDLAWADADHVVALASTNASDPKTRAPYLASVDGSAVQPVGTVGLPPSVTSITAAPDVPMIAEAPGDGSDGPEIFVQSTDSWERFGNGRGVRYPD